LLDLAEGGLNRDRRRVRLQIERRVNVRHQHRFASRNPHRVGAGNEASLNEVGVVQVGDQQLVWAGDIDRNTKSFNGSSDDLGLASHIGSSHRCAFGVGYARKISPVFGGIQSSRHLDFVSHDVFG